MSTLPTTKREYPFLDGFRALAVLWVIWHHVYLFFYVDFFLWDVKNFLHILGAENALGAFFMMQKFFDSIAYCGNLGVDMFFVISGFLITGLLVGNFEKSPDIIRFYTRRCLKIIPQYLLAVIVGLILARVIPSTTIQGMWAMTSTGNVHSVPWSYFLFLQNCFHPVIILDHLWSLAIEEHFYFFYPLLLSVFFLVPASSAVRRRRLIGICVVLMILANVIRIACYHYNQPLIHWPWSTPRVSMTTLFRFDALAMGCVLRLLEPFYRGKAVKVTRAVAIVCLLTAGGIYYLFFTRIVSSNLLGQQYWYTFTLAYIAPACLLLAAYLGFFTLANNKALRWIGRNSYGIYLWHYILIFPFAIYLAPYNLGLAIFLYVGTSILVGFLSTVTVEKFFLQWREKVAP